MKDKLIRMIIKLPPEDYLHLKHIAERHMVHQNQMAEAVIRQFVKNMKEKAYPHIEDLDECLSTNTDAEKTDT